MLCSIDIDISSVHIHIACGGFDVSIKSDFLAERYIFILHEYIHLNNNMYEHTDILHHERVKYTKKLTVCLSVCGRAAGPIGLYLVNN